MFLITYLSLCSCVTAPKPVFGQDYKPPAPSITVMTYNVENLFDTDDDPERNDDSFLPLSKKTAAIKAACRAENDRDYRVQQCISSDWSDNHLELKLKRLAHVIRRVKDGKGPDILFVQEVENQQVLDRLRVVLGDLGYKPAILIEGPDERSIDVGIITRFDLEGPVKLHHQNFVINENLKEIRPTRGILEATLKLPDGQLLTVFGVHFPSQGGPTELRRQALLRINELQSVLPKDRMAITAGDFNITSEEDAKERYAAKIMSRNWAVSHLMGCKDCDGTYYYGRTDSWSFFDIILVSKNMTETGTAPWKVVPHSVRIENTSKYQINSRSGGPSRFNNKSTDGVSDHWPIALDIVTR